MDYFNRFSLRYANFSDVAARHVTNVGQRFAAVFLRIFHFWNHWRTTLGRNFKAEVFFKADTKRYVSQVRINHLPLGINAS